MPMMRTWLMKCELNLGTSTLFSMVNS